MSFSSLLKKIWHFLWYEDSLLSWFVNLILAFVLVKFVIYPGIGFLFGTAYPIVAVVSGSMEHHGQPPDGWWEQTTWYEDHGITRSQFTQFPFKNGFNKGDIMVLQGVKPEAIKIGDVLVYESSRHVNPIIHRVVAITEDNDEYSFQTKGDNNPASDRDIVSEDQIRRTGKAILRLPFLGWIKIGFVQLLGGLFS